MAHNLNMVNGKAAMFFTGEKPWHGLGTEVMGALTAEAAIKAAGLDWAVDREEVYRVTAAGVSMIPGKRAIVRHDTGAVFNVLGEGYTPIENREAFSFFDSVVGDGGAIYHTAGALGAGEKTWILAKLPKDMEIDGTGDKVEKYLLLSNAHDGTQALRMHFTPVRVVCQNTLNLAQSGRGKGEGIAIRHTAGAAGAVQEAQRALGLAVKFYDGFDKTANELAARPCSRDAVKAYFEALIPDNVEAENKTRTENIRKALEHNFAHGAGNDLPGISGSWWAALNAVTEYVDHDRSTRGETETERRSNRLESLWFGSGARVKAQAWDTALELAGVAVPMAANGKA
jgi:phage/plasmid-like protein (TIGR03299 family)